MSREYKIVKCVQENIFYQSSPVRASGIQVDIGQRNPSLWCLELSDDARGLVVCLHRLDSLQVEVDVLLSLTISHDGLQHQVSGSVNRVTNNSTHALTI